jgi:hypothetical protein
MWMPFVVIPPPFPQTVIPPPFPQTALLTFSNFGPRLGVMRRRSRAPKELIRTKAPELHYRVLIEALCAAHLSSYVESEFQDRGGIILVGPPGVLKTTFLSVLDRQYFDAVGISDINAKTLALLKNQIAAKSIRTLVITELRKLYERDPRTAGNVEGTLRAMVAEGFHAAGFEDARINRTAARCVVVSAVTPEMQEEYFAHWEESGFGRRFLWPLIVMKDPGVLDRAVENGKVLRFRVQVPRPPLEGQKIPDLTTRRERREIRGFLKSQPGGGVHNLQQLLLVKMLAVLKWWYIEHRRSGREAFRTIRAFAQSLQDGGVELVV